MGDHDNLPPASRFLEVGSLAELPPGTVARLTLGGLDIALANVDGHAIAVGDLCLRCGSSLASGQLAGAKLTCSACAWQYDVESGAVEGLPGLSAETLEVRVVEGRILVDCGPLPTEER